MTCGITVQTKKIHIISLGVSEQAELTSAATAALQAADIVIGSPRQLKTIATYQYPGTTLELPKPIEALTQLLADHAGKSIALLGSGDALFYGIGNWLKSHFSTEQLVFHANISSIQAACHNIGLDRHQLTVISLHGRPLSSLRSQLRNHRSYGFLTDANSHPNAIARHVIELGFEASTLWVCERLGYKQQTIRQFAVSDLVTENIQVDPLHVILLNTLGKGGVAPEFPGIADLDFNTDKEAGQGLLTKREVRLNVLSLLQPTAQDIGWDIGAGCGGVSVEWARWNSLGKVFAIEKNALRFSKLRQNQLQFAVQQNLILINDAAPACLSNLPPPNAIFVGGSGGALTEILQKSWAALNDNPVNSVANRGRLVASAVTEQSKSALVQFVEQLTDVEAEWVQISVSRGSQLGGQLMMRPLLPVTLLKLVTK